MNCPSCNTTNNYYHVFCYQCGNKLPMPEEMGLAEEGYSMQLTTSQLVWNPDSTKKNRRTGAFRKVLLYAVSSILGVSFVVMLTIILSNAATKQKYVFAPPASVAAASPNSTLPIEKVMLKLQTPKDLAIETDQVNYQIEIVSAPEANVKISGTEMKTLGDGRWNAEVPLKIGVNRIEIEAKCEGFLTTTETVVITRTPAPPKLLLDAAVLKQTDQSTLVITGKTEPNASLSTSLSAVGQPIVNAEGLFQLIVQLPVIPGEYDMTVKSIASGIETSVAQKIIRLLNEKEYAAEAVSISYAQLAANPLGYKGKVLDITGTVYRITSSAEGNKVFMLLVKDKRSDQIVVEYAGQTKMVKGATLHVYCDFKEIKEGVPVVVARVVQKVGDV